MLLPCDAAGLTRCRCTEHVVFLVFGRLTDLILLCNTFYVIFLFPLKALHIFTVGVDLLGWGAIRRKWAGARQRQILRP